MYKSINKWHSSLGLLFVKQFLLFNTSLSSSPRGSPRFSLSPMIALGAVFFLHGFSVQEILPFSVCGRTVEKIFDEETNLDVVISIFAREPPVEGHGDGGRKNLVYFMFVFSYILL